MELPPQPGAGPESAGEDNNHDQGEREREHRPRIYVASLSDYNAGILHGIWLDAADELDDLNAQVQAMLDRSSTGNAEEYAVHDFDGWSHYRPSEYDSLDWLHRIAAGIEEHGLAFSAWAEHCRYDQEVLDRFEDAYRGNWPSLTEYAEEVLGDLGYLDIEDRLPEIIQPYVRVDVEAFARDLGLSGDITSVEHESGVWIFDGTL